MKRQLIDAPAPALDRQADALFERVIWALVWVCLLLFGLGAGVVLLGYLRFSA